MKIKWIALDFDGTLLNTKKQLPKDFLKVKKQLSELGITFILASGRQYENIKEVVKPHEDEFLYISNNGTLCYENDELVDMVAMDKSLAQEINSIIRRDLGLYTVINHDKGAFVEKDTPEDIFNHFGNFSAVISKEEKPFEKANQIVKLSVYDANDKFEGIEVLDKFLDNISVTHAGETWIDVAAQNVSKGTALKRLCERHGFSLEEGIAFGDAMNDEEMLDVAGYAFVMANGDQRLQNKGYYNAASNDDEGVMDILNQLLERQGEIDWLNK